jgi:predicted methyltransferase
MLVLDFDERVLVAARNIAAKYNFTHLLDTRRYNVFDPLPKELLGQYDWFYTNPPYGSQNEGASARLFITRGCELVRPSEASGCVILPDDKQRPWTRCAMSATQQFFLQHGWTISDKLSQMHKYHLDDDCELSSSLMIVHQEVYGQRIRPVMPYAGRAVQFTEIPMFYGRKVVPPYARYIGGTGVPDHDWSSEGGIINS